MTTDSPPEMLEADTQGDECTPASRREWRVLVRSVGTAGAEIVSALARVLRRPEQQLAACIYQAPSELIGAVDFEAADALGAALRAAGLEVEAQREDEPFESGDPAHDVALVIEDVSRMIDVVREIGLFLGVGPEQAQQIAYACPAELIGKVSASTVDALQRRFGPLGVSLDVSRVADAPFDVFLEPCAAELRARVERRVREAGFLRCPASHVSDDPTLVCAGLRKPDAEELWSALKPLGSPLRILNRDFERFDLRLEQAPDTPEMIRFLVMTAGIPEHVARKIPLRTPVVTHHNVRYRDAGPLLQGALEIGARLSAHLRALQRFGLHLAKVQDPHLARRILKTFEAFDAGQTHEDVRPGATICSPLTLLRARWLQLQLKRAGTDARLISI